MLTFVLGVGYRKGGSVDLCLGGSYIEGRSVDFFFLGISHLKVRSVDFECTSLSFRPVLQ